MAPILEDFDRGMFIYYFGGKLWLRNFRVPMLYFLNVGTVPMLYFLNVGTVPMLYFLNVGTVPMLYFLNVGTVPKLIK